MAKGLQFFVVERSAVGPGLWLIEGAVISLPAGVKVPEPVRLNCRPYDGALPVHVEPFNLAYYESENRPRVEVAAPKPIDEAEIRQWFSWADDQWTAAQALGFPKPTGVRLSSGAQLFERAAVQSWATRVASLDLGAGDGWRR